jgi:hypothetical protein
MDQIRTWLFIGGLRDTQSKTYLASKSIGAILQPAVKIESPGITALYLPVEDLAPIPHNLLRQGVQFVREIRYRENASWSPVGLGSIDPVHSAQQR